MSRTKIPSDRLSTPKKKLFELMLERERSHQRTASQRVPRADRGDALPLSFAQQRLWFLDRLEPGNTVYNLPLIVRLSGPLEVSALECSLDTLVHRHEALRTTFALRGGHPVQIVAPELRLPLAQVDLRAVAGRLTAEEIAAIDHRRPYDLEEGPLLRATLVRESESEHLFVLNMHHIISDGWSLEILVREIGGLYQAFAGGDDALPLAELPIQYADFAVWQRELIEGGAHGDQLEYWQGRLESAPTVLELPLDHPRPPIQSVAGRTLSFTLPAALSARANRLAKAQEVTLFALLLTVFEILLSRTSGQRDLVVGTPVANRNRVELEGLIGFFVNTLVLRTEIDGDPSFREVLRQVSREVVEALQHQDIPFERLVEELHPQRDVSRPPLFQVMFVLQNKPKLGVDYAGVRLSAVEIDPGTSKFDLTLTMEETPRGLAGKLEFPLALFAPSTIERLERHFETLLRGVVEDPGRRLSQLAVLSRAERQQVRVEWNDTQAAGRGLFASEHGVQALFEQAAEDGPDRLAVVFEDRHVTYGELDAQSGALARSLRRLGVGPEARVGVCLERSVELVVALLATLKAGGAYVPFDPEYPVERLDFMLAEARPQVLITRRELAAGESLAGTAAAGVRIVHLDAAAAAADRREASNLGVAIDPDHPAYAIYTSGSTGRPKGAVNSHRAIVNRLLWMQQEYRLEPDDRVLQKTPFSFDVSVWEFFWPLLTGACLVVARPGGHRDPAYLVTQVAGRRITTLHFVPSMLRAFLEAPGVERCSGLRRVIASGEALGTDLEQLFFSRLSCPLHNLYGPTEAAVDVSFWACRADAGAMTVPIGRPIANVTLHLLDPAGGSVPIGVAGELHIGGVGLARGYLERPALTAERFVPDAAGSSSGSRLYRTGDLVRLLPDGNVAFLGRLDHQVKVRGFRIELGEVEAALEAHSEVRQAVATVRELAPGDRRLVAYAVASTDSEPAASDLRGFLARSLPEVFIPSHFVWLEELPLTASGKVNRAALPAPESSRPELDTAYAAPRSDLEQTLVKIWKELLKVDHVGVDDSFFDLGGHSMLLVEVHARLRDELGAELAVVDLFQYPTIRSLAGRLAGGDGPSRREESLERARKRRETSPGDAEIAIVAMALRMPDADTPEAFWDNLRQGVNSIRFFPAERALAAGVPKKRLEDPSYILAEASLGEQVKWFDASFFGYSPREAKLVDPQQRLFLEACWEALERAGHSPDTYAGRIGVFGSTAGSSYMHENLKGYADDYDALSVMSDYFLRVTLLSGNTPDFLAQKVAYHLGLEGPCINVQTACSSALVAVHLASESLRRHECDMALAGGVQIRVPEQLGYLYLDGGLPSPDGCCRPFDARAGGTVHGNGLGVVVLRRLEDALADGDPICAVIKGSAVNNDGSQRVGFTAPSVEGQAKVVTEALAVAGVSADTVRFVEAHGTATDLGDPIEVSALTQAFRLHTEAGGYCALGSVKSNIGHLDTSAGIASLIKATLAVQHGEVPPTVHFEKPNPKIDFENSPFFVNNAALPWPGGDRDPEDPAPRRALVNVFAIGGTNANVVLEEAPPREPASDSRPWQLVNLSARTSAALDRTSDRLAEHLRERPETPLADVAFTLSTGRKPFNVRRAVVCRGTDDLVAALEALDPQRVITEFGDDGSRHLTLFFSGGAEARPLGAALCSAEDAFGRHAERCAEVVARHLPGSDLLAALDPAGDGAPQHAALAVAAGFTCEYALARLWMDWGLEPQAVAGVGAGEWVAACLAGVLSLEDALEWVIGGGPPASTDPARLAPPSLPLLSAAAGDWLQAADATDLEHWRRVARGEGAETALVVEKLVDKPGRVLLEVGLGGTLSREVDAHCDGMLDQTVVSGAASSDEAPQARLLAALGRLWAAGLEVDWPAYWRGERRRRRLLPTYPFERELLWIERRPPAAQDDAGEARAGSETPAAQRTPVVAASQPQPELAQYVAPRGRLERKVAMAWEEILGIEDVGVHDELYEPGGDPLLAGELASRLRAFFDVELGLEELLELRTVAEVAAALERKLEPAGVRETGRLPGASEEVPGEMVGVAGGDDV